MAKSKPTPDKPDAPPAEYTVLARRYRPRQFTDLVGQEPVAQSLKNAIESNRVAHAYLFTGARGVGKTSTARILAKALNCANGPTATPCDQCDICAAISSGEDMDVLEIDAASNRGIEEIRALRQNVQFRPSRARYKIYIIDEVHMLTREAFNALLKTLEEPPAHVKFIMATTEAQKIPITILSRCQRFDFAGIGMTGIVERLQEIIASEGMQAEPEALTIVARRAAGSMRDAQSLLDQLLAFGGDTLTAEQVHRLLGTANEERVAALAGAVLTREAGQALALLGQAVDQGLQLGELLDQLIEYWRDLMVVNCAGIENQDLSVTGKQLTALKEQADRLNADTILAGLDVLVSAKNRMRFTSHGRVVMEMALVRLCRLDDLVSLSQLAQWVSGEGAVGAVSKKASPAQISGEPKRESPSLTPLEKKKVAADEPAAPFGSLTKDSLAAVWEQVLAQVGFILASELKKVRDVAIAGPNALVLRIPVGYNLTSDQYLDSSRLAKVEETLGKVVGQACSVRLEVTGPDAGEQTARTSEPAPPLAATTKKQRQRSEIAQVPLVGKALEALDSQIMQIDDDFGASNGTADTAPSDPSADKG